MASFTADSVDRAKTVLKVLREVNHSQVFDVIEKIGEAEDKRGELIAEYVDRAKKFYLEMRDSH